MLATSITVLFMLLKFIEKRIILKSEFRVLGQGGFPPSSLRSQGTGIRQGCPLSPLLFVLMLSWLMEGVDRQYASLGIDGPALPVWDVFYADDTILLSTTQEDLQARFSLLEGLAAQVGLYMNRDKTVLILAKVKSKQTLGAAHPTAPHNRKVDPFRIKYSNDHIEKILQAKIRNNDVVKHILDYNEDQFVKIVESEYYLGSRITRTGSALQEIKHRIGLGHKRADDLKCLWRGTGISRRRKLELVDSLIASKIL